MVAINRLSIIILRNQMIIDKATFPGLLGRSTIQTPQNGHLNFAMVMTVFLLF